MTSSSDKDILKAVSNVFNSSKSFEEFAMKLDLENVTLDDAEKAYTVHFAKMLSCKCCCRWCEGGAISFKKMFDECDFMSIVLPAEMSTDASNSTFMLVAYMNGNEIPVGATYDLMNDLMAMHMIDIVEEIMGSLLNTLSYEGRPYRIEGVGHGAL